MKRVWSMMVMAALPMMLAACGNVHLVMRGPVPIEQREDYRRVDKPPYQDQFYMHSHLVVVNATDRWVKLVQNGTEHPGKMFPRSDQEIQVNNEAYREKIVHILAVAYDNRQRIIGRAEKTFRFTGDGTRQVEQWVLKDHMFQ